jgi:hypothetical protein
MRNACFGVIVADWYTCSHGDRPAGYYLEKCTIGFFRKPLDGMFRLVTQNPKTGHDAPAWLRGVTLIPTPGTTLKRPVPLGKNRCPKRAIAMAAITAGLVSACTSSPYIGVLGAYFPDWMFCIVAGVVLTAVIYVIATRLQAGHLMGPSAVVYPTLVAFLALAVWLMLFQH